MPRLSSSHRYDILTSAEAWSLIGTLDADEFAAIQREVEKLAWSAFSLRSPNSAITKADVTLRTLAMSCEIDHVARRVTVMSLSRRHSDSNRIIIDGEERPFSAVEVEEKTSGGAGKKR